MSIQKNKIKNNQVKSKKKLIYLINKLNSKERKIQLILFFIFLLIISSIICYIVFIKGLKEKEIIQAKTIESKWTEGGVLVSDTSTTGTWTFDMVFDSNGGVFIVWVDERNGTNDIYAQYINDSGIKSWGENGLVICNALYNQNTPKLILDGSGGIIIVWNDYRDGNLPEGGDLYIQRVNSSGVIQWIENGINIADNQYDDGLAQIIPDGEGGAFLAWIYSGFRDIYVQEIDSNGDNLWQANGVSLGIDDGIPNNSEAVDVQLISDGSGGIIVSWYGDTSGNDDVYAQRIDGNGDILWGDDGVVISNADDYQGFWTIWPTMVSDGSGGAIITWEDQRSGSNRDIYAQRVNSEGIVQWLEDGIIISNATNDQNRPNITSDGSGGAIITWDDLRSGDFTDIYAQRVNSQGIVQWTENGKVICNAVNDQYNPSINSDNEGGAFIAWSDYRLDQGDYDMSTIYVQHIDSSGNNIIIENGYPIGYETEDNQDGPRIISNSLGETTVMWINYVYVDEWEYEIYIQKTGGYLYQITNLESGLDALDTDSNNIEYGTYNGLNGDEKTVILRDTTNDLIVAEVQVDMNEDRDWNSVDGESNIITGKSYAVNLNTTPGAAPTFTLYVPIPNEQESTSVVICPNITTLDDVQKNCNGALTKTINSPDTEKVIIDSVNYWKVSNLTSTGGISIAKNPNFNPLWDPCGTLVTNALGDQSHAIMIPDGSGGVYVVWEDSRSGIDVDLYAQHINSGGERLWTPENGIVISDAVGDQVISSGNIPLSVLVLDNQGGVVIVWQDNQGSDFDIYAQRITSNGDKLWTQDGILVCDAINGQVAPAIVSDGNNGVIIVWEDERELSEGFDQIYSQRLDNNGNRVWSPENGIILTTTRGGENPIIESDDNGGAIISWIDWRDYEDIYAQRVDISGNKLWVDDVCISDCTDFDFEWRPLIIKDGVGGAIFVWNIQNNDDDNEDIYGQRINSSGAILWSNSGVLITPELDDQYLYDIEPDGSEGVIILWRSYSETWDSLYTQRLDGNGNALWDSDIDIADSSNGDLSFSSSDNNGGAYYMWNDNRIQWDIYSQFVNSNGSKMFSTNGDAICMGSQTQVSDFIVSDNLGGAILVWEDERSQIDKDLYLQRLGSINGPFYIINLSNSLDVINEINGENMRPGGAGSSSSSVPVRLKKVDGNLIISDIVVNMTAYRNWETVSADSDLILGKSVVSNITEAPGASSTHSLYIPIPSEQTSNSLIICPNATTLDEVTESCTGFVIKTESDSDTSKTNINGQVYWKVENLTSSGGMSVFGAVPSGLSNNGEACIGNSECNSGYCVDGYCCNDSCTGTCRSCDYSGHIGECFMHSNNTDSDNECLPYWNLCVSKCVLRGGDGYCDGQGECDTNDRTSNIPSGYVCSGNGVQTNISSTDYCNFDEDCDTGDCTGTKWYTSCDGIGNCRESSDHIDSLSEIVYSENEFTLTDSCYTKGTFRCKFEALECLGLCQISGSDYRCDSTGQCNIKYGDGTLNCEAGTACSNGSCLENSYCDLESRLSKNEGDNMYGIGGNLYCLGSCDGQNNCDYASICSQYSGNARLPETGNEDKGVLSLLVDSVLEILNSLRENEIVVNTTKYVGIPLILIPIVGEIIQIALPPISALGIAPLNLILSLSFLIVREKKNHWGIVYDRIKNTPIPFAVIRVINLDLKNVVITKVTDLQGRYSLKLNPSSYKITIKHSDYKEYEKEFKVYENNSVSIEKDIALEPKKVNSFHVFITYIYEITNKLFKSYGYIFLFLGSWISLYVWLIIPHPLNFIIVLLYVPMIILYCRSNKIYPQNGGRIIDSISKKIVCGAFVKLFIQENRELRLIDSVITDLNGNYGFLIDKIGEYFIYISANNYTFPSKVIQTKGEVYLNTLKVIVGKNKLLKQDFYIDPLKSTIKKASPFGK